MSVLSLVFVVLAQVAFAAFPGRLLPRQDSSNAYPAHTFDQLIDHFPDSPRYKPHTNATFKQRYFFDSSYYKPGGPVFLYIGGEVDATTRFSNLQTGIIQILMQATNGLGVILENRYYGDSFPFNTSTTDQLTYFTTEQVIADNPYFAQHATFPGVNGSLNAPHTPWIVYGGSLAGAQTAFTLKAHGDVLYAGIAASGVIEAKLAYPEWYDPIQKFASQDCVASINAIVDDFDGLVASGNRAAVAKFKSLFGLESLKDDRDFGAAIAFPIGGPLNYPTYTWQELCWNDECGSQDFFYFCDNVTNIYAPENITQVDYALSEYTHGAPWKNLGNYANYVKKFVLPLCPGGDYDNTECFGTQNQSYYADPTNTGTRSYLYTTCTESGAYQVAPAHGPTLLSRTLQVNYTQQWCTWAFPPGEYNSIPPTPDLNRYLKYGGFNFSADRLAFIDGNQDVWLDLCYHSNLAPARTSSIDALHPELLITGSGHHWDSYGILDINAEPQFIREAHKWEIRQVQQWLRTFSSWKPKKTWFDD